MLEKNLFVKPPGFIVRINAAAPRKVGKTKGIGRITLHTFLPYKSVRLVNHASKVPIRAVVKATAKAKDTDRQSGVRILFVPIRLNGSESSVKFRQTR